MEPTATHGDADVVLYRVDRGVAVVTLNRPGRMNAWTPALERAYVHALRRAAGEPEVRAVVVTGANGAFCAGADTAVLRQISEVRDPSGEPSGLDKRRLPVHEFEAAVPKPVIAAVEGPCVGIGFSHALLCDMRFATPTSRWCAPFARLGLVAEQGSAWLLERLIGRSRAADLLFSARIVGGEEAYRIGLVDRLADDPLASAVEYAAGLAANSSPTAMAMMKQQLHAAPAQDFVTAAAEADRLTRAAMQSVDFREGLRAFGERRPPSFPPLSSEPSSPAP